MAAKVVNDAIVYEEFEPFCKWQRNQDHDILEIHLQDFKKEELKVQISNQGILKICGEHILDESKRTKFYKEVPVPNNKYDPNAIHAKFVNSNLIISIPKLKDPVPQPNEKLVSPSEPDKTGERENVGGPSGATPVSTEWRFEIWKQRMMGLRMAKVATGLAAASAAVAVLTAVYVVYMYHLRN